MRLWVISLHALNALVLAGVTAKAWLAWPEIPARVPKHFNAWGEVDRWGAKDAGTAVLFALPWIFTLLTYGMRAAMGYFGRHPEQASLSPRLRGLRTEQLRPLFTALQDLLLGVSAAVNLTLGSALYGMLKVAAGLTERMPLWTTPPPWLVVIGAVLLVGLWRVFAIRARLGRE